MKRVLLIATMVVVLVSLMTGTALAGGWWTSGSAPWNYVGMKAAPQYTVGEANGYGVNGSGGPTANRSPHLGFSASTNNCKTCHAVHNADDDSWRLLRGRARVATQIEAGAWSNGFQYNDVDNSYVTGTDYSGAGAYETFNPAASAGAARVGECDVCHLGTTSLTYKRQYKLPKASVRAEHSLGYNGTIPDSDTSTTQAGAQAAAIPGYGESRGLQCWTCHTVHGANRLGDATTNNAWTEKILRNDANKDGKGADGTAGGANQAAVAQANLWVGGVASAAQAGTLARSMICGDCHNYNWRNPYDTAAAVQHTHPSWEDDSRFQMEVYGDTLTVAWKGAGYIGATQDGTTTLNVFGGCRACHRVSNQYSSANAGPSIWPHQGVGFKFLTDSYTDQDGLVDKANLVIVKQSGLDSVCLRCHRSAQDGTATGDGVGSTF